MKIAIATDFFTPWAGGPATFVENFLAYLADTPHQVTVLAPSATGAPSIEARGNITIRRMPTVPFPVGYGLRVTVRLDAVRDALLAAAPDVLQAHHPFPLSYAAIRAARAAGIPVVAVNHTIPECALYGVRDHRLYPLARYAFNAYLTWLLRQATAVCTPTATAAALLRAMGYRRPIEVISNGIDTARFNPGDKHAARGALGLLDRPLVLSAGRLDAEKDMPTWLRAAALVAAKSDAYFVIGGQGADRPKLERQCRDLGIAEHVSFLGFVPAARLPLLYQAADLYCITGAVELQSITTLEAMASGLPVVAARAAALPELVEDGVTGYLAPVGDAAAFARAMLAMLRDPASAAAMGRAGRRKAEVHALPRVCARHEALLARAATMPTHQARTISHQVL